MISTSDPGVSSYVHHPLCRSLDPSWVLSAHHSAGQYHDTHSDFPDQLIAVECAIPVRFEPIRDRSNYYAHHEFY